MLVNLTPNHTEIARRLQIAKENNFEWMPQNDPRLMEYGDGIYQENCPFNFSFEEFMEFSDEKSFNNGVAFEVKYNLFAPDYLKAQYGVADTIDQIKEYFKEEIEDPNRKFFISMSPVFQDKSNAGKGGGWRWHKWGEYIGKLDSKCEYLDDEDFGDDFEYVICFHIYEVK